jgi:hypothetical protein
MNFDKLHALAAEEAVRSMGTYVEPSKDFERAIQAALCELTGLKPADPTVESRYGGFVGEKGVRVSAEKKRFPDEIVGFFRAELEVQMAINRGVTQLEVVCHNIRDNGVNMWGDTAFVGFRLR